MRKFARKDANHKTVCDHAESYPYVSRIDLSALGNGYPDELWCVEMARGGFAYSLVEIKDGKKPPSARKLTPEQRGFHQQWPDAIPIVTSIEDADRLIASLRNGLSYV